MPGARWSLFTDDPSYKLWDASWAVQWAWRRRDG